MKYENKHETNTEKRIVEFLIHQAQIKSGNTGVEKAVNDKKTIGTAKLAQERVVNVLNPEHKKFNDKRNRKRREKRESMKKGTSDAMRNVLDSVANAKDLMHHITGK